MSHQDDDDIAFAVSGLILLLGILLLAAVAEMGGCINLGRLTF
jgi:hypothetical protein